MYVPAVESDLELVLLEVLLSTALAAEDLFPCNPEWIETLLNAFFLYGMPCV